MDKTTNKTILIVEDEEDVTDYLDTLFEDYGYNVITANNASSGFERAKVEQPDLISLDISMPGESGVRLFSNLCESPETKNIPVVIVTGFSSEFKEFFDKLEQSESPAGYFEKPIDRDALLNKIEEIIG